MGPNWDMRNFFVAIGGVVVGGGIAIWAAHDAQRTAYDVARLSGSFDRPNVTLGIAGKRLRPDESSTIIIGLTNVSEKETVAIGSIPFSMANEGTKTADEATLTVQYARILSRQGLASLQANPSGPFQATEVKMSLTQNEAFDFASYKAPVLAPGVGLTIHEPFYAKATEFQFNETVKFKDGIEKPISFSGQYLIQVLATTIARDQATRAYPLKLAVTRVNSMQELIGYAEKNFIARQATDIRKQLSFFQYLRTLLFANEDRRLYVVFEQTTPTDVGENKKLEFAPKPNSAEQLTYKVLSFDNLFASSGN
jgi:hypothetical protein